MPPTRRVSTVINAPTFTIAERAVANANPACANGFISITATPTLTSMAITAITAGVFVSWRA